MLPFLFLLLTSPAVLLGVVGRKRLSPQTPNKSPKVTGLSEQESVEKSDDNTRVKRVWERLPNNPDWERDHQHLCRCTETRKTLWEDEVPSTDKIVGLRGAREPGCIRCFGFEDLLMDTENFCTNCGKKHEHSLEYRLANGK